MIKYIQALIAEAREGWAHKPTWSEAEEGVYFSSMELLQAESTLAAGYELPFDIGVFRRAAARNTFATYIVCWWEWAGMLLSYTRCRVHGHDWKDESYGGPDSGCMAGSCSRCGHSFHHTLY